MQNITKIFCPIYSSTFSRYRFYFVCFSSQVKYCVCKIPYSSSRKYSWNRSDLLKIRFEPRKTYIRCSVVSWNMTWLWFRYHFFSGSLVWRGKVEWSKSDPILHFWRSHSGLFMRVNSDTGWLQLDFGNEESKECQTELSICRAHWWWGLDNW